MSSTIAPSTSAQTPAYVDFTIIVILLVFMTVTLYFLIKLGESWKKKEQAYIDRVESEKDKRAADAFEFTNGYSWDFVIVFKYILGKDIGAEIAIISIKKALDEQKKSNNALFPVAWRLHQAGIESRAFYSIQNDEVYLKVRAPPSKLLKEAERTQYKLQYDPIKLREYIERVSPPGPPELSPITKLPPYEYMYGAYDSADAKLDLFKVHGKCESSKLLREVDRIKLLVSLIEAPKEVGGAGIKLEREKRTRHVLGYFPLQNYKSLADITNEWLAFRQNPWSVKIVDDVKDYFGEKIGLYALWLQVNNSYPCVHLSRFS